MRRHVTSATLVQLRAVLTLFLVAMRHTLGAPLASLEDDPCLPSRLCTLIGEIGEAMEYVQPITNQYLHDRINDEHLKQHVTNVSIAALTGLLETDISHHPCRQVVWRLRNAQAEWEHALDYVIHAIKLEEKEECSGGNPCIFQGALEAVEAKLVNGGRSIGLTLSALGDDGRAASAGEAQRRELQDLDNRHMNRIQTYLILSHVTRMHHRFLCLPDDPLVQEEPRACSELDRDIVDSCNQLGFLTTNMQG